MKFPGSGLQFRAHDAKLQVSGSRFSIPHLGPRSISQASASKIQLRPQIPSSRLQGASSPPQVPDFQIWASGAGLRAEFHTHNSGSEFKLSDSMLQLPLQAQIQHSGFRVQAPASRPRFRIPGSLFETQGPDFRFQTSDSRLQLSGSALRLSRPGQTGIAHVCTSRLAFNLASPQRRLRVQKRARLTGAFLIGKVALR